MDVGVTPVSDAVLPAVPVQSPASAAGEKLKPDDVAVTVDGGADVAPHAPGFRRFRAAAPVLPGDDFTSAPPMLRPVPTAPPRHPPGSSSWRSRLRSPVAIPWHRRRMRRDTGRPGRHTMPPPGTTQLPPAIPPFFVNVAPALRHHSIHLDNSLGASGLAAPTSIPGDFGPAVLRRPPRRSFGGSDVNDRKREGGCHVHNVVHRHSHPRRPSQCHVAVCSVRSSGP